MFLSVLFRDTKNLEYARWMEHGTPHVIKFSQWLCWPRVTWSPTEAWIILPTWDGYMEATPTESATKIISEVSFSLFLLQKSNNCYAGRFTYISLLPNMRIPATVTIQLLGIDHRCLQHKQLVGSHEIGDKMTHRWEPELQLRCDRNFFYFFRL